MPDLFFALSYLRVPIPGNGLKRWASYNCLIKRGKKDARVCILQRDARVYMGATLPAVSRWQSPVLVVAK